MSGRQGKGVISKTAKQWKQVEKNEKKGEANVTEDVTNVRLKDLQRRKSRNESDNKNDDDDIM